MDEERKMITVIDEDGKEHELELLGAIEYENMRYAAFLPTDMAEDNPDFGLIILRVSENDELEEVDDEGELMDVYEAFKSILDEDEED